MTVSNRAWAELLLLSVVWSASFLTTEIVLREMGPITLVLWRVGGAAAALWLVMAARSVAPPKGLKIWGALMIKGLFNNAIPFALISWGQESIETELAAIRGVGAFSSTRQTSPTTRCAQSIWPAGGMCAAFRTCRRSSPPAMAARAAGWRTGR
jgi:hypothetical protein